MKSKLLLLVQDHSHAAALMGCCPHIRANYDWVWVVYSPAVLADPALVEREFDQQIAEISKAMKDCYGREDGAGGDAYKAKRDAAILDKAAKVKEAWKGLAKEAQDAAVDRIFGPFFKERPAPNIGIHQAADHFETAAHVEFQNSLKAAMPKGYGAGQYVVAWPTSLPSGETSFHRGELPQEVKDSVARAATQLEPSSIAAQALTTASAALEQNAKLPKKPGMDPRLKELLSMDASELGLLAFDLGVKPNDPILTAHRLKLAHHVHKLEKAKVPA